MKDHDAQQLANITLAPYLQKATALIGKSRKVGGNQFRHAIATMGILMDYGYFDSVLLKASVIHDLLEDIPDTNPDEIKNIDADGPAVLALVLEVTQKKESKRIYLERILKVGSTRAKILKVADRISNLTDLHRSIFKEEKIQRQLDQSEEFVLPMAEEVDSNMAIEMRDLIGRRRNHGSESGR